MQWVKYEREGAVAIITMNRPERLNAWGPDTSREIGEAFQQYDEDDEARVAILCGAGRSFCAGGDAKEYRARQAPWSPSPQDEMGIFGRGRLLKPVIAAIQGHCLGAGLLLIAMRCDIRVAADNALFGLPEARVGIVNCEVGISNQAIPLCVLMELTMTADSIDAQRAREVGIVNRVVPLDQLMPECRKLAERIAQNSPAAIRMSKQILLKAYDVPAEAKRLESELFQISSSSKDAIGGFSNTAVKMKNSW
jgi:enoyl-CoA hydratase/carnithine racemase